MSDAERQEEIEAIRIMFLVATGMFSAIALLSACWVKVNAETKAQELQRELDFAVYIEDYEQAAKLRDMIKSREQKALEK